MSTLSAQLSPIFLHQSSVRTRLYGWVLYFFFCCFIINTKNLSSFHSQNTFLFSLYLFAAQHNWTIVYYGNLNSFPYHSTSFILTVHPRKSPGDEVVRNFSCTVSSSGFGQVMTCAKAVQAYPGYQRFFLAARG